MYDIDSISYHKMLKNDLRYIRYKIDFGMSLTSYIERLYCKREKKSRKKH